MKTFASFLLVVVVAAAAWLYFSSAGIAVRTATVHYGEIRQSIDDEGKTRLPKTFLITMPFTGRIEAIELSEGAPVEAGQVVARVVPRDLELEEAAARAAVERLRAAIRENDDASVEKTGLQQALKYVQSMDLTVEAAEKRVEAGRAKQDLAQKTFDRVRALREGNRVPEEALNQAETALVEARVAYQQDVLVHRALEALQAATALVPTAIGQHIGRKDLSRAVLEKEQAQAEARQAQAEQNRQRGTMTSPVDGVVLRRTSDNEQHLAAGTVLLEIGRLEDLEVEADILSQDVVDVAVGDEVDLYGPAIGSLPVRGRVRRIYPAGFTKVSSLGVEQQRVKVIVALEPGELESLRSRREIGVGYRVNVRIYTESRPRVLVVPRSALFRAADGAWQVFAVRDGRARQQTVEVGLINDDLVEITAGLDEGQTIIIAPQTHLEDGARVTPGPQ